MKIEDNHYTYRIETKDSNGGSLDFIDIDTVEPLRCAYDIQDELNLETNEHIKRVEEIVLDANSTEFWYVDEARTSDTHLVCYFEEVELMASKDHPMVDTDRSLFEYGKINSNEHQNTNFICTHVMDNGVSRIYMSIDKETFGFTTFDNETIKYYISNNPITVWYALRYEVIIPRSLSKGHLLTLSGQTDVTLTTNNEQAKLPIMKFNIGDTQYTLDTNPIHINNTQEGTQIRNIVLEGNTPINYARGNGVNTTEETSNTRYDFAPFYDGQATISNTVEGGYVSAKLYGDTMVNIAKPYGETPLLTATNNVALCDDLLCANEEGIVLADGEITEGRIIGKSYVNIAKYDCFVANGNLQGATSSNLKVDKGDYYEITYAQPTSSSTTVSWTCWGTNLNTPLKANTTYTLFMGIYDNHASTTRMNIFNRIAQKSYNLTYKGSGLKDRAVFTTTDSTNSIVLYQYIDITRDELDTEIVYKVPKYCMIIEGNHLDNPDLSPYEIFDTSISSVVNPTVYSVNENLFDLDYVFNKSNYKDYKAVYESVKIQLKPNTSYYFERNTEGFMNEFKNTYILITSDETPKENGVWMTHATNSSLNAKNITFTTGNSGIVHFNVTGVLTDDGQQYLDSLRELHFSNAFLIENSSTNKVYTPHKHTQSTFPYTLNKLPNGVADYIDVVNKVHVQRVKEMHFNQLEDGTYLYESQYKHPLSTIDRFILAFVEKGYINRTSGNNLIVNKLLTPRQSTTDDYSIYLTEGAFIITLPMSVLSSDSVESALEYLAQNDIRILYEITPIYTPLTEEEIAQLPLSAYKDGYVMLSSDQLMPSFEFRMKASNRYQVDMLETGYYYLNAPVGNVRLGTANVDVQQMPCIVKVDNVGTGDSGYRLSTSAIGGENIEFLVTDMIDGGYYSPSDGQFVENNNMYYSPTYYNIEPNTNYGIYAGSNTRIALYDETQTFISNVDASNIYATFTTSSNVKYCRFSSNKNYKKDYKLVANPITLAKLPSYRIPTSFTQGMRCGTDFGYWEGIKVAKPTMFRTSDKSNGWNVVEQISIENGMGIELNRIEYGNTIVEDEFDIATGKLTRRIGKMILDGSEDENWKFREKKSWGEYQGTLCYAVDMPSNMKHYGSNNTIGIISDKFKPFFMNPFSVFTGHYGERNICLCMPPLSIGETGQYIKSYLQSNPTTIYYELEVPQISYIALSANQVKTVANTALQCPNINDCLFPQTKPSHLTYPVPSLVGNRTYTVVHNRKNISGSTKPIELNLGGTVVQLNDASSKTLVKTPSTLAHSNLIFIGGESTVDHIMILDGDWTNKPIEYFENMKGHDTDAIITIIGDGKIDDVAEQYLW